MRYKIPILIAVPIVTISVVLGLMYGDTAYATEKKQTITEAELYKSFELYKDSQSLPNARVGDDVKSFEFYKEQARELWPQTVELGEAALSTALENNQIQSREDLAKHHDGPLQ